MQELQKIKRDIAWLIEQTKCLTQESNLESPLVATEWSPNHSVGTGNPYILDCFVWYQGNVYKSLMDDNIYPPTNDCYWTNLGPGHLLLEEQSDWNATTGRPFIRNKPLIINDKTYVHNQVVASSTWLVTHNLNKYPSVSIVDSGENLVVGDIHYIDLNNILITFTSTFSGKAYFN